MSVAALPRLSFEHLVAINSHELLGYVQKLVQAALGPTNLFRASPTNIPGLVGVGDDCFTKALDPPRVDSFAHTQPPMAPWIEGSPLRDSVSTSASSFRRTHSIAALSRARCARAGVAARARHAVPRHPKLEALSRNHPHRGRLHALGQAQGRAGTIRTRRRKRRPATATASPEPTPAPRTHACTRARSVDV
eukprot:6204100-Pleurochrysis_carterae.AAC.1